MHCSNFDNFNFTDFIYKRYLKSIDVMFIQIIDLRVNVVQSGLFHTQSSFMIQRKIFRGSHPYGPPCRCPLPKIAKYEFSRKSYKKFVLPKNSILIDLIALALIDSRIMRSMATNFTNIMDSFQTLKLVQS